MKLLLPAVVALLVNAVAPAYAQVTPLGPSSVVIGHVEIVGRDLDAHKRFWSALGGTPDKIGVMDIVRFPGGFLTLRKGEPTAGSAGSLVDHVGLNVKSMQEWLPKWQAAGLRMEPQRRPTMLYLIGPDDVRVEVIESTAIETPVRMHHLHYFVQDPLAVQAWYAKVLGAAAGKRGQFDKADIGGVELTFAKNEMALAGTKGRSLDHIGFEVKNLDAFVKNVEANGVTVDRPSSRGQSGAAVAYLTDPWGTYLELTEGLAPK